MTYGEEMWKKTKINNDWQVNLEDPSLKSSYFCLLTDYILSSGSGRLPWGNNGALTFIYSTTKRPGRQMPFGNQGMPVFHIT